MKGTGLFCCQPGQVRKKAAQLDLNRSRAFRLSYLFYGIGAIWIRMIYGYKLKIYQ